VHRIPILSYNWPIQRFWPEKSNVLSTERASVSHSCHIRQFYVWKGPRNAEFGEGIKMDAFAHGRKMLMNNSEDIQKSLQHFIISPESTQQHPKFSPQLEFSDAWKSAQINLPVPASIPTIFTTTRRSTSLRLARPPTSSHLFSTSFRAKFSVTTLFILIHLYLSLINYWYSGQDVVEINSEASDWCTTEKISRNERIYTQRNMFCHPLRNNLGFSVRMKYGLWSVDALCCGARERTGRGAAAVQSALIGGSVRASWEKGKSTSWSHVTNLAPLSISCPHKSTHSKTQSHPSST
jgi:hypothetical protein